MLLACAKMNRFLVLTSGVLASLAAVGQFLLAAFSDRVNHVYCSSSHAAAVGNQTITTDDVVNGTRHYHQDVVVNDDVLSHTTSTAACHDFLNALVVVAVISGIGWVLSAWLAFAVACHLKQQRQDPSLPAWNNTTTKMIPITTTSVAAATKVSPTSLPNHTITTNMVHMTETTQVLPNGSSSQVTQSVHHVDGFQTERIETPMTTTSFGHDTMTEMPMTVGTSGYAPCTTTKTTTTHHVMPPPLVVVTGVDVEEGHFSTKEVTHAFMNPLQPSFHPYHIPCPFACS